jgi:uncharacterized protein HemX
MGITAAIAAVASAGASVYSSVQGAKATKKASTAAQKQNEMAMAAQQRETKRAEQRAPNTAALLAMAGQQGGTNASTISAGPSGMDINNIALGGVPLGGKRTMLGG